jgi:hypothetical protein
VLGRDGEAAGVQYWEALLASGVSRASVAQGFLTSSEAYVRAVNNFYAAFLGRAADDPGRQFWVSRLQNGMSLQEVASGFLSCDEFIADAARTVG